MLEPYDWAIANGDFKPSKPNHETIEFIGRFSDGDVHHHYEAETNIDVWGRMGGKPYFLSFDVANFQAFTRYLPSASGN